jgi:hypothetical protein
MNLFQNNATTLCCHAIVEFQSRSLCKFNKLVAMVRYRVGRVIQWELCTMNLHKGHRNCNCFNWLVRGATSLFLQLLSQ